MANKKIALMYYAVDTDRYQDGRIKRLKKKFKGNGVSVYDYILCECYRVLGCYIVWDADQLFDVADYWDLEEGQVAEIVHYCLSVGLFNNEIFAKENILTSHSIQTRYLDICKKAKRTGELIPNFINLIQEESHIIPEEKGKSNIILEESHIIPEESIDSEGDLPGSKVKKSKVKKSKVKEKEIPEEKDTPKNLIKNLELEKLWFIKFLHGDYVFYKKIFNGQSTTEEHFQNWKNFVNHVYEKNHHNLFDAKMVNPHDFATITEAGFSEDLWEPVIVSILATGINPQHDLKYRIPQFISIVQEKNAKNGKFNRSSGSGNGKEIKFDKP